MVLFMALGAEDEAAICTLSPLFMQIKNRWLLALGAPTHILHRVDTLLDGEINIFVHYSRVQVQLLQIYLSDDTLALLVSIHAWAHQLLNLTLIYSHLTVWPHAVFAESMQAWDQHQEFLSALDCFKTNIALSVVLIELKVLG